MTDIEKSRITEIITLHNEIAGHLRTSLEKALRIGQLLTEQKDSLKHGEFTPWLKENLPFTDRTARNYMRLHQLRHKLKTETISDLSGAYNLLRQARVVQTWPKRLDEPEEDESDWDPDKWLQLIKNLNDDFSPDEETFRISEEHGPTYEHFLQNNDGSMTEREIRGFSLKLNFMTHLCYCTRLACAKGIEKVPSQVKRYLEVMWDGRPVWLQKISGGPMKLCWEGCAHGF